MSYKIKTEIEKNYLKFTASGEQTFEANTELVAAIIEACIENKVTKVLVDIRGFIGQPGIVSDYKLANIAAKGALGIVKKTALLHQRESSEFTTFFETATRNRGIDMRVFMDESEAVEWLLNG